MVRQMKEKPSRYIGDPPRLQQPCATGGAVSTPQLPRPLDLLGPLLMRRVRPLSDAGGDGGHRDHCAPRAINLALRGTVTIT